MDIQQGTMLAFLSHLCGGEVLAKLSRSSSMFLSHLCGGEELLMVRPYC